MRAKPFWDVSQTRRVSPPQPLFITGLMTRLLIFSTATGEFYAKDHSRERWSYLLPPIRCKEGSSLHCLLRRALLASTLLLVQPYTAGQCDAVLKWKPADLNTVDFRLNIVDESKTG